MKRAIDNTLLDWKNDKNRKVLLVRGARQVGKTYSIRSLGKTFKNFVEVNFEEDKSVQQFFAGSLNPLDICQKLSAYYGIPIAEGDTLLFFDEIQACPEAFSSLRFFYEKMPKLHVVAAGSLLELLISEIPSYGVGRIKSLFMFPMSFDEFLMSCDEEKLIRLKKKANTESPLDDIFHQKLINYLKVFYIIGGMPEVIKEYSKTRNILSCHAILNDLLESLKDDFAKYKKRIPSGRLREVFDSIALQAGGKFKYSNVESLSYHKSLKESLDLIVQAGLAHKVYHTSAQGIPLGAQVKVNQFKILLNDPGIHQKVLGLNISDMMVAENFIAINQGNISEIFVGVEILKYSAPNQKPQLFYWHKEQRGSNAEIDYLIQKENLLVPIEVKSGTKGQMQSLRTFLKNHDVAKGVRISLENFASYKDIDVYPLYAVSNLMQGKGPK